MLSRQEKRELKAKIVAMALSGDKCQWAWATTSLQKRPYTGTKVYARLPSRGEEGRLYSAIGFSKVCYPDKWDPDYGIELAIKKAAADIVRQWDEYLDSKLEGVIDD